MMHQLNNVETMVVKWSYVTEQQEQKKMLVDV